MTSLVEESVEDTVGFWNLNTPATLDALMILDEPAYGLKRQDDSFGLASIHWGTWSIEPTWLSNPRGCSPRTPWIERCLASPVETEVRGIILLGDAGSDSHSTECNSSLISCDFKFGPSAEPRRLRGRRRNRRRGTAGCAVVARTAVTSLSLETQDDVMQHVLPSLRHLDKLCRDPGTFFLQR